MEKGEAEVFASPQDMRQLRLRLLCALMRGTSCRALAAAAGVGEGTVRNIASGAQPRTRRGAYRRLWTALDKMMLGASFTGCENDAGC